MKKLNMTDEQKKAINAILAKIKTDQGATIYKPIEEWAIDNLPPEFVIDDRAISLDEAKNLPVNTEIEVKSTKNGIWFKTLYKGIYKIDPRGSNLFYAGANLYGGFDDTYEFIRWPEGPKMQAKLVPLEEKPLDPFQKAVKELEEENCDNCNRFNYSGITCGACENFSKWEPQQ